MTVLPMSIFVVVVMVMRVVVRTVEDEEVAAAGRPTPLSDSLPSDACKAAGMAWAE